jgi:hypothetical protein
MEAGRKIKVLNPDDVEIRLATMQSADDVAVEVFVCSEPQHGLPPSTR